MRGQRWVLWGMMVLWLGGCALGFKVGMSTSAVGGPWQDGTFSGTYDLPTPQLIVVDVMITQGHIVAIRLRQHPDWKAPDEQEKILRAVVTQQATDVYKPRNDASEQDRLLQAIEDALEKARQETPRAP